MSLEALIPAYQNVCHNPEPSIRINQPTNYQPANLHAYGVNNQSGSQP